MDKNVVIAGLGIAAAAVAGYVIYKKSQTEKSPERSTGGLQSANTMAPGRKN